MGEFMNKHKKKIIINVLLLLFLTIFGFLYLRSFIKTNYYFRSIFLVFFSFIFLLILNIFIIIGRIFIESETKKKYLSIIIPIILSILLFLILKNKLSNSVWGITDYSNKSIFSEARDFYMSIYDFLIVNKKLEKFLLIGNIFNIVLVTLYFINDRLTGLLGYIYERLLRVLFSYTYVFLFLFFSYILPFNYYYVRYSRYISMSIILLILCITFYRIFISFTELHRLNNSLINKEDLLVIINQDNFSSRSIGLYRNPLRYFKNYNIEKIINNLVIRSKNVSFISYDCIRYNLVRLNGYKNVGYVILTNNNELYSINKDLLKNYYSYLDLIIKDNKHFVFVNIDHYGIHTDYFEEKYKYRNINNIRLDNIINIIHLNKEDIELHDEVSNLYMTIDDSDRFKYIKNSLFKIMNCYDDVEILYSIIKMGEYVVHYRALINIVSDPSIIKNPRSISKPSFGVWSTLQNYNKKYTSRDILALRNNLIDQLDRSDREKSNDEVTFIFLVNLLVTARNKYLGHGSISTKKAKVLNYDLFKIIKILIDEFKNIDIDISTDSLITNIFDKDIYAIKKINGDLYLYMNNLDDKTEYLDYGDGKIYIENTDNKIYLNTQEDEYATN